MRESAILYSRSILAHTTYPKIYLLDTDCFQLSYRLFLRSCLLRKRQVATPILSTVSIYASLFCVVSVLVETLKSQSAKSCLRLCNKEQVNIHSFLRALISMTDCN